MGGEWKLSTIHSSACDCAVEMYVHSALVSVSLAGAFRKEAVLC